MRKFGSVIVAGVLVALVATACIVRSNTNRRSQPVYVEGKHKKQKGPPPGHMKHVKHKH
jgi:hypothetical protein